MGLRMAFSRSWRMSSTLLWLAASCSMKSIARPSRKARQESHSLQGSPSTAAAQFAALAISRPRLVLPVPPGPPGGGPGGGGRGGREGGGGGGLVEGGVRAHHGAIIGGAPPESKAPGTARPEPVEGGAATRGPYSPASASSRARIRRASSGSAWSYPSRCSTPCTSNHSISLSALHV